MVEIMVSFNSAIADKLNALSQTTLNGHYIFSREYSDALLAKRFSTPLGFAHNISYEYAETQEDLNTYYQIREEAYRDILQEKNFSGAEDEFDRYSFILLIKAGNRVVGGARLTVSDAADNRLMPLEADGFDIKSHFPQLDFSKIRYCEMSRLALLPEFRNGVISQEIHQKFIDLCREKNIHVGFARTTPLQQRRTKTIFSNLGHNMIIRRDIKLPHNASNQHLNMQFSCVDFTIDRRFEELLKMQPQEAIEKSEKTEQLEFA